MPVSKLQKYVVVVVVVVVVDLGVDLKSRLKGRVSMASGINFYSQLVISAIRISDISNLITDITNSK